MSTSTVYELRKEGKKEEAYQYALSLYQQNSTDDDIKKALSWTLIDLCKKFVSENNLNQAQVHYNQVSAIKFDWKDDFVETIQRQILFLKPKIDIHFSKIQNADNLSKSGQHKQALIVMQLLIANNQLSELHHEIYGWIIYRYIKAEETILSSVEVRTYLRDYMNLKNARPSMLHSMILNFALNYSKTHDDFKFYDFFTKWWKPENLRYEDLHDGRNQKGDKIPSLISRICREFINSDTIFDIKEILVSQLSLNPEIILDFFREPYFWKIYSVQQENKFSELWQLFENYKIHYSKYGKSKWHSEILNIAERFMIENEEWRFLNFFKYWNPQNFRDEDWKEIIKGEDKYKPLAIRAIKKVFEILKNNDVENNLSWLIESYKDAVIKFPDDNWLLREKALLHLKNKEFDLAIRIYKKLVLDIGDKHYIWQEFASCCDADNQLKIGMQSKALDLEKNEDFLGDIHLELTRLLVNENLLENALMELEAYKKHREFKGWKVSQIYEELLPRVGKTQSNLKNNRELYVKYIALAENFAYSDFTWHEVVLVDKWKDEKEKDRLAFTDGKSIGFQVGKNRFNVLKHAELGQVFRFKLHKQELKKETPPQYSWKRNMIITEYRYIPLLVEKSDKEVWSILEDTYAIVDYFNVEKKIIHAITFDNKEVFFPHPKNGLKVGDFVTAKFYIKKVKNETKIEIRKVQGVEKNKVILKFQNQIGIVDGLNDQKQIFHFVINSKLQGTIKYSETNFRPKEADFIKLWFVTKLDREKNLRIKVLNIEPTYEINQNLRKEIKGLLNVKFRNNYADFIDFEEKRKAIDSDFDNSKKLNTKKITPDFAFIGDFYVSKPLLERHEIISDCEVKATVIYTGDKWKVIEINRQD